MARWLRRLFILAALGALGIAAGSMLKRRRNESMPGSGAPPSPPFTSRPAAAPTPAPDWAAPVEGVCPDGYPIKANENSHIYHVPGGRFYDRTIAERCYATGAAAERDGYRRAKT